MTFSQFFKLAAFAGAMTLALPGHAQDEANNGWSGEGSLSAGVTTGNTETTDLGLGVDVARAMDVWTIGLQANADYGETDGAETKNRIFLGTNLDRQINDRLFGFGQLSYERDEFSGFESRAFIGGGLGYEVLNGEATQWTVRGGPVPQRVGQPDLPGVVRRHRARPAPAPVRDPGPRGPRHEAGAPRAVAAVAALRSGTPGLSVL